MITSEKIVVKVSGDTANRCFRGFINLYDEAFEQANIMPPQKRARLRICVVNDVERTVNDRIWRTMSDTIINIEASLHET